METTACFNGCECTEAQFDYESYQSLSIRVAAMDEHNASVEDEFLVSVTDANETDPNQEPVGLYHVGSLTVAENDRWNHCGNFFLPRIRTEML